MTSETPTAQFDDKCKFLESMIGCFLCFKCKDVPGFKKDQRIRYLCLEKFHPLCNKCKSNCECGSSVMESPNPVFEQQLQDLPVFCSNYKEGCRFMCSHEDALNDHNIGCEFRFGNIHKQRLLTGEARGLPPKGEKRRQEEEHSFQQRRRLLWKLPPSSPFKYFIYFLWRKFAFKIINIRPNNTFYDFFF